MKESQSIFLVYHETNNTLGLLTKDLNKNKICVETEDKMLEYDGVGDYLNDGWEFAAYFGESKKNKD